MRLPDELFESIVGCESLHMERDSDDRRSQGRVRVPSRVHAIPMSQNMAANPINAQVRDMSAEGIGLLLPRKLSAGDNLLIRLVSKETTLWVFCDVKRVEKVAEGLFVTGAIYNRIISPQGAKSAVHA
jgi:hypothetical protein